MTGETVSILVITGSGVYTLLASTFRLLRDKRALNWPTVSGEVVVSRAKGKWNASSGSGGATEVSYLYSPEVVYVYTVEGESFEGTRTYQFEISSSSQSWAEKSALKFPVGSEVEVFYNPRKPNKSMHRQAALKLPRYILSFSFGACLTIGGVIWHLKQEPSAASKPGDSTSITRAVDAVGNLGHPFRRRGLAPMVAAIHL